MVGKVETFIEAIQDAVDLEITAQSVRVRVEDDLPIPLKVHGRMVFVSDNQALLNYIEHERDQPLNYIVGKPNTWE